MVVPALNNAHLEVKNSFLHFPIPTIEKDCRRSSSCPSLVRFSVWEEEAPRSDSSAAVSDDEKVRKDTSGDSTDCGIRSCSSLDSATMDSPSMAWHQLCEMDQSTRNWHQLSAEGFPTCDSGTVLEECQEGDLEAYYSSSKGYGGVNDCYEMADWDGSTPSASPAGGKKVKGWSVGRKAKLLLRGLPFSVDELQLANFIDQMCGPGCLSPDPTPISLLRNQQNRPSGFADVYLSADTDPHYVREKIHLQRLGGRYIEVLSSGGAPRLRGGGGVPSASRWSGASASRDSPKWSSSGGASSFRHGHHAGGSGGGSRHSGAAASSGSGWRHSRSM